MDGVPAHEHFAQVRLGRARSFQLAQPEIRFLPVEGGGVEGTAQPERGAGFSTGGLDDGNHAIHRG